MITITDENLAPTLVAVIPKRTVGGWMAWVKQPDGPWNNIFPRAAKAHWELHPGCLYPTREEAIADASAIATGPTELKLFYVVLEK